MDPAACARFLNVEKADLYNNCPGILENKNWNQEWEKNFKAIKIGDECLVRASFHPSQAVKYELVIEPKMAFGTGHHATTAMVMSITFSVVASAILIWTSRIIDRRSMESVLWFAIHGINFPIYILGSSLPGLGVS